MNGKMIRMMLILVLSGLGWGPAPGVASPNGNWYVATTGNNANSCNNPAQACASIQYVVDEKATNGDTIYIAGGTYTGSGDQVVKIDENVTLSGGWNSSFSQQDQITSLDGQHLRRLVTVDEDITTTLAKLRLVNGDAGDGGAILSEENLTLVDCLVKDNVAHRFGGGIYTESDGNLHLINTQVENNSSSDSGGGIYVQHFTKVENSAVVNNQALMGAGIYAAGNLHLVNSTVTENNASGTGGAVYISGTSVVKIHSSTIAGNQANQGGGVYHAGQANAYLLNTILTDNSAVIMAPNCFGNFIASYSIIYFPTCNIVSGAQNFFDVDPELGPAEGLPTYLPSQPGEPPVNTGNPAGCLDPDGVLLTTDQRGKPRYGDCDRGAYELQPLGFSQKVALPEFTQAGAIADFIIYLNNTMTTSDIPNVTVEDALPADLAYVDGSLWATHGTPGYSSGVISWNGTVPAGVWVQIHFKAQVNPALPLGAKIWNEATITDGGETFVRGVEITTQTFLFINKINQGCEPVYFDDFTDMGSGWPQADMGWGVYRYQAGWYNMELYTTNAFLWVTPGVAFSSYTYFVDAWDPLASAGTHGLLFGLTGDTGPYYTFELDNSGGYYIWKYLTSNWELKASGVSPAIKAGQKNRLIVDVDPPYTDFYVNGFYLGTLTDPLMPLSSTFGLAVDSTDSVMAAGNFDNATILPLVCGPDFSLTGTAGLVEKQWSPAKFGVTDARRPSIR